MKGLIVIVILIQTAIGQVFDDINIHNRKVLRWCVISKPEKLKCKDFAQAIYDSPEFQYDIECVQKADKHQCMQAIDSNEANIVTLDAGEIYVGGRYYSLAPVLYEKYTSRQGNEGYYAVAVVKADSNITKLEDLRNRKICFSGVGHMAGWVIPISTLIEKEVLKVVDCNNLMKTASSFFGPSCAPNALNDKYNPKSDNPMKMCELCAGWRNGRGTQCSGGDLFSGYEGAFKCMASGNGEVAFLTHTTVMEMVNSKQGYNQNSFRIFCPDGSLRNVVDYISCNWGKAPSHAVVISSMVSAAERVNIQDTMMKTVTVFSKFDAEEDTRTKFKADDSWAIFTRKTTKNPFSKSNDNNKKSSFKMFESSPRYGNYTSLLFQDTAQGFARVPDDSQTFSRYLGSHADYLKKLQACPVANVKLCVVGIHAFKKCNRMLVALNAQDLKPALICVQGETERACMGMIKQQIADLVVLEAGDVYKAGQYFGLKPIIAEKYDLEEPAYYAVAMAQGSDSDTDLQFLKNKRSCHGAIGTAAGWTIPIDFLTRNKNMRRYGCDSVKTASQFFSKSCVPGALSKEFYGTSSSYSNLCDLCHGSSSDFCKRDISEPFYGNTGALRCLTEGGGEVAFLKHSAVYENMGGVSKEIWARNQQLGDYELLCSDGTRAPVSNFRECNLGMVPSNAIVARESDPDTVIDTYLNLFMYAQQHFGYGEDSAKFYSFAMYASDKQYPDQIFQDVTQNLLIVPKEKQHYKSYLGKELIRAIENTDCTAGGAKLHQSSYLIASFIIAIITVYIQ